MISEIFCSEKNKQGLCYMLGWKKVLPLFHNWNKRFFCTTKIDLTFPLDFPVHNFRFPLWSSDLGSTAEKPCLPCRVQARCHAIWIFFFATVHIRAILHFLIPLLTKIVHVSLDIRRDYVPKQSQTENTKTGILGPKWINSGL